MAEDLPEYHFDGYGERDKYYFNFEGHELVVEVKMDPPHYPPPENIGFKITEVTDGQTSLEIRCTKKIRAIVTKIVQHRMNVLDEIGELK